MSAEQFAEEFGNSISSVLNPVSFEAAFNFKGVGGGVGVVFNGFLFCCGALQVQPIIKKNLHEFSFLCSLLINKKPLYHH